MDILDVQLKSVSRRVKDMGLEPLQVPNDTSPECEACREALAKGAFRKLGAGQFGAVYLIDSPLTIPEAEIALEDGRTMTRPAVSHGSAAVKILHDTSAVTERDIDDFRREMSVLRGLHHPNILTLLGFSENARPLMLITEYADSSMESVLQRHVMLPLWRRLELAYDFAMGLEYLHSKQMIHRDLKPANLLVVGVQSHFDMMVDNASPSRTRPDDSIPLVSTARIRDRANEDIIKFLGHLEICDFGLTISTAASTSSEKEAVAPTGNTGSYRFMAPEVHRNEVYGEKADIFSFGMILYWIVDGQPPFTAHSGEEAADLNASDSRPTFKTQRNVNIGTLGNTGDTISRAIKLVKQCWAANPKDRPNATAICTSLEAAMKDCPRPAAAVAAAQKARQRWALLATRTRSSKFKHQKSAASTAYNDDTSFGDRLLGLCMQQ